ncbi:DUF4097 family beta strand repeat-containing protein [Bacillus sp. JJ722]|uniref:DUF4097 family beta strand repeat-containing protein n=1 Tax=Bacillus sp. JJ722 TaxID=3122973 RepID=UPI003000C79D
MKKVILTSIGFIVVCGVFFSIKEVKGESFEEEKSFKNSIEEIEINNKSWDIEFKDTKSNKIKITVEGKQNDKKNDPVTIKKDGKKIVVNQHNEDLSFIEGFTFGKRGTIYISIPKDGVDAIILNNKSGDIKMKDVTTKYLVISNVSGSKKIVGLKADKGIFTSKAGELGLQDSSLKELTVASKTGDNYINNVVSPKMKITSTDGEVSIKDIKEGKSLFAETKTGDITVSYKETPTSLMLTANSNSNDVTVNLKEFKTKKNTEKSQRGTIGDASNKLKLLSKKGTITVK